MKIANIEHQGKKSQSAVAASLCRRTPNGGTLKMRPHSIRKIFQHIDRLRKVKLTNALLALDSRIS
jgi:hypothetical protein